MMRVLFLFVICMVFLGSLSQAQTHRVWQTQTVSCCDRRGDIDQSGNVDLTDLTILMAYLDNRGSLMCFSAADLDNDGGVDISDLSKMIDYLYISFTPFINCDKTLMWTAVGDDGIVGKAARYDLRYSSDSVVLANWTTATPIVNVPTPSTSGGTDSVSVFMNPDSVYYFGLKVMDKANNWSAMSNIVKSWTTQGGGQDVTLRIMKGTK